jgi:hypothetical protein
MRHLLEREDHFQVPPLMFSDPFFRITHLIKDEIRKYKWLEGEKGRRLSWKQARKEWATTHQAKYEEFLFGTLSFTETTAPKASPAAPVFGIGNMLATLPHRTGG